MLAVLAENRSTEECEHLIFVVFCLPRETRFRIQAASAVDGDKCNQMTKRFCVVRDLVVFKGALHAACIWKDVCEQ